MIENHRFKQVYISKKAQHSLGSNQYLIDFISFFPPIVLSTVFVLCTSEANTNIKSEACYCQVRSITIGWSWTTAKVWSTYMTPFFSRHSKQYLNKLKWHIFINHIGLKYPTCQFSLFKAPMSHFVVVQNKVPVRKKRVYLLNCIFNNSVKCQINNKNLDYPLR